MPNDVMPFTIIGTKTANELNAGDWIISHAQFVQVTHVNDSFIYTTHKRRRRFGDDYRYNVYQKEGA